MWSKSWFWMFSEHKPLILTAVGWLLRAQELPIWVCPEWDCYLTVLFHWEAWAKLLSLAASFVYRNFVLQKHLQGKGFEILKWDKTAFAPTPPCFQHYVSLQLFLELELLPKFWFKVFYFFFIYFVTSILFTEISQFGIGKNLRLLLMKSKAISARRSILPLPTLHILTAHGLPIKALAMLLSLWLCSPTCAVVIQ